jgi:chromosomal replication initiation ATPase DnaA
MTSSESIYVQMPESLDFIHGYELGLKTQKAMHGRFAGVTYSKVALKKADIILGIICGYFEIQRKELLKRCRKREIVYKRQIALYFLRVYSNLQLKIISELFAMDHSSVLHSYSVIVDAIDIHDSLTVADVKNITVSIEDEMKRLEEDQTN